MTNYRWVAVVFAALAAGLVAALVTPRMTESGETNWIVTVVVAVVAAAGVWLATRERIDPGAHVRDDAGLDA